MPRADPTTMRPVTVPTVLTIACSLQIERRCARACARIGAVLKHGKLERAPTLVAERRPLVIVLPQEVYAFDPLEFDALARDVGASLLRVGDDTPEAVLEMLLGPALDAALARRKKQGALIVAIDDPRAPPPSASARATVARRRSWADSDGPPSSAGARRA